MPEIGEVARIVSRLRQHIVGKVISKVDAVEDTIVFKDTSAAEFMKQITGKKVVDGELNYKTSLPETAFRRYAYHGVVLQQSNGANISGKYSGSISQKSLS